MSTDRDDRADPALTEQLLSSGALSADAPPPYDEVAAVLAAADAPPSEAELAGAEAAGIRLAAVARMSPGREKGMTGMWRSIRQRVPNVVLGVIIGMMVGGGAFAVAQTVAGHGGPKARFHDKKVCDLVDTNTLPGNWTHGDYVSAVEKKDPSKVREAAQSDCGKPVKGSKKGKDNKGPKTEKPEKSANESSKPGAPETKKPAASPSPKASVTASPSPSPEPTPSGTASITTPST